MNPTPNINPPDITIYTADCLGDKTNCLYPHRHVISNADSLQQAVSRDYVTGEFKGNYRSLNNFIACTTIGADCDNDHSENPQDWITPEDVHHALPGIPFGIHYSRNHMKQKGKHSPRPRYHVLLPLGDCSTTEEYDILRAKLQILCPYFDDKAMDATRFYFGTKEPKVSFFPGTRTFQEFLAEYEAVHGEIILPTSEETVAMPKGDFIPIGKRNSELSRYAAIVLKRHGKTEQARQLFLERASACEEPLPDKELNAIWKSALKFLKSVQADPSYIPPEQYNAMQGVRWEKPITFEDFVLPPFPQDALPTQARDFALAVAETTQTPVDMAGTAILGVLASCTQGKYVIRAKKDWTEPLNLYVLLIAEPSERKSAVISLVLRPVNEYEAEYNKRHAAAFEKNRMEKRILEKKQRSTEDKVSKGKADIKELEDIAVQVATFQEISPMQLYVDDITPEKLISVLSKNDGIASVISAEGGIFDQLAGGMYSKSVNIDVFLKGHAGDTIRIDCIGRNSESVTSPALTLLLAVQPSVLAGMMQNGTFRGRGLTARFLYTMPETRVGNRRYRTLPIPEEAERQYKRLIHNLLDEDSNPTEKNIEVFTLSSEADALLEEFSNELEPKLRGEYADFSDWAGKLCGAVLRISGLLCRAEHDNCFAFLQESDPTVVDGDTMRRAIALGNYYTAHARAAFQLMGADPIVRDCKYVLNAIRDTGLMELSKRDILRLCRRFRKAEDLQPALDRLCEYGYLAQKADEEGKRQGRPTQVYLVNPAVYQS